MSDYGRFKLPTDAAALRISCQSQEQYENVRLAASDSNGELVERRVSERRVSADRDSALRAEPAGQHDAGVSAWLPIATAPRDGTHVLLGRAGDDVDTFPVSTLGWWMESLEDGVDYMGNDAGFTDCMFDVFAPGRSFGAESRRYAGSQPTHWMPLPPAPDQPRIAGSAREGGNTNAPPMTFVAEAKAQLPAALPVADKVAEREAFETWAVDVARVAYRDEQLGLWFYDGLSGAHQWIGWQARASLATHGAAPELTDARTLRAALVAVTDALDAIGDIPNSKIATAWCAQNSEAKIKHARAILATTKKAGQ